MRCDIVSDKSEELRLEYAVGLENTLLLYAEYCSL